MTTPQTMDGFIAWLKLIEEEAKAYYPDNDSQREGYQSAIEDVLYYLLGPKETRP